MTESRKGLKPGKGKQRNRGLGAPGCGQALNRHAMLFWWLWRSLVVTKLLMGLDGRPAFPQARLRATSQLR